PRMLKYIFACFSIIASEGLSSCPREKTVPASIGVDASTTEERPYNVLFIAIDDLNDYVSLLQDYPGLKTPNLDKFAKSAYTFTNAYTAAPACNPSRAAVLTGRSPVNTGMYQNSDHFQSSPAA